MKRKWLKPLAVMGVIGMMVGLSGCQTDTATDYKSEDGTHIELQYAENFDIEYLDDDMKIVTDEAGDQLLLLQEGQEAPEEYADLTAITIPLTDAIYTSTTQVGFLRAFDDDTLFDSIIGVRQAAEDWDFDAMKSRMESGAIVDIGSNTTSAVTYDYEIIQSLEPNLVFTSTGMSTEQQKLMEMLDQNGIAYIMDTSSSETDYRGTAEWVKFYAAFYNLEEEATEYYNQELANIDEMQKPIEGAETPKVGWGIVTMGKVYVENAGSKSAQMVRDAGGEYLFDDIGVDQDGVTSISVEELYSRLSEADIFINRGMPKYGPDIKSITDQAPVLADLEIFNNGNIWQITDSYWSNYNDIDEKYIELAAIFHPELYPDQEFENFVQMPAVAE
jgi:iron complex transport system substrate-binding protein